MAAREARRPADSVVTVSGAGRAALTRERILTAAERLFAEQGVHAVSNRQVSEAAGQGNNTAVGYHFGSKADLVRAIVRRHIDAIEATREQMVAEVGAGAGVREWVACMVRPITVHLDSLGSPTWFARFAAQIMTDPELRGIMTDEALGSPPLLQVLLGLERCLPTLPHEVRSERAIICRILMVHVVAEREQALAHGEPPLRASWQAAANGLVDAIVGVWLAPVTATADG